MKQKKITIKCGLIILVLFFMSSVNSIANVYNIRFVAIGESITIDSVIVQNLTKGTNMTLLSGYDLVLSDETGVINTYTKENSLYVFPNPIINQSVLSFYSDIDCETKISIFNLDGRKVLSEDILLQKGNNFFGISLIKGFYLIQCANKLFSYDAKVISLSSSANPQIFYMGNNNQEVQKKPLMKLNGQKSITMSYNLGDQLLFKSFSGKYSTIVTLVPTSNKTVYFDFVGCQDASLNNYSVVHIGTQTWMAENIRTIVDIPNVMPKNSLDYNGDVESVKKYGLLYNWTGANKAVPVNWRIPSDNDWSTLFSFLGGSGIAGGKLQETNVLNPYNKSNDITNESGFSAKFGGFYDTQGKKGFQYVMNMGMWWSTSYHYNIDRYVNSVWAITKDTQIIQGWTGFRNNYFSLRCINSTPYVMSSLIKTTDILSIGKDTAICGGNVLDDGGYNINSLGVCWSTAPLPTIELITKTNEKGNLGMFTSKISGLTVDTVYYVRAYYTNDLGTQYGEVKSFSTKLPKVTTDSVTTISTTTANCGGNVISVGGTDVLSRGICWSTSNNPTINDNSTNNGVGIGSFKVGITGLKSATKYYVRSYATNSIGTTYGNEVSFTTIELPKITTSNYSSVMGNSALAGGNIVSNGRGTILHMGLCWDVNHNPTLSNNFNNSFTDTIKLLIPNTVYYVRAYATNEAGTSYGNEISFNSGYIMGTAIGGGLVFYNDGNGHGLVCASSDQSTSIRWTNETSSKKTTGATSTGLGSGNTNTNLIVSVLGATGSYAAKLCSDLVLNNYSDWYLPSIDEVSLMLNNLNKRNIGGFRSYYWSSTEKTIGFAYSSSGSVGKTNSQSVRAVRNF